MTQNYVCENTKVESKEVSSKQKKVKKKATTEATSETEDRKKEVPKLQVV